MKGIEIFLVTKLHDQEVCFMESKECQYYENEEYSIMFVFRKDKSGISLIGKLEEKEIIEKQLKDCYRKELQDAIKELQNKLNSLDEITA